MSLINFQLISLRIQPNQLFKAIESVISSKKISEAIVSSKSRERRNRNLPGVPRRLSDRNQYADK